MMKKKKKKKTATNLPSHGLRTIWILDPTLRIPHPWSRTPRPPPQGNLVRPRKTEFPSTGSERQARQQRHLEPPRPVKRQRHPSLLELARRSQLPQLFSQMWKRLRRKRSSRSFTVSIRCTFRLSLLEGQTWQPNNLFSTLHIGAVLNSQIALDTVISDWSDSYEESSSAAMLKLINFLIRCCGCKHLSLRRNLRTRIIASRLLRTSWRDIKL